MRINKNDSIFGFGLGLNFMKLIKWFQASKKTNKKKTSGLIGALILSVRRWVEGVESQK